MTFIRTTAINKIRALTARKKVIQGGTSAGKTFGILPILIDKAAKNERLEISVVSESIPHLRRGAMKDFIKIMMETGRYNDGRWNRSLLTYNFANGSYIEFFSADQEGRLRGARRNVLYVNEANNIPFEAYHQMAIRTSGEIYLDFNPTQEFWAHTEVLTEPDAQLLILNYLDNEALPETIKHDIEQARERGISSPYWANWWKVYGLGQLGSLQGVVFNNWQQCDKMPEQYKWKAYGIDWGFTNDPTAVVEVCEFQDAYYINEILYEKGLTNSDIAAKIGGFKGQEFIADSAEPKSIEDLRRHGFRIRPCEKGRDSVRAGIDKMQQMPIFVTSHSTNVIRELRGYTWATDKTGAQTGEPIDDMNHAIDATRYAIMEKKKTRSGQYSIR
jgi:phage terminase large subunit